MALFRQPLKSASRVGRISSSLQGQVKNVGKALRGLRPTARSTAWLRLRRKPTAAERVQDVGKRLLSSPTFRVLAAAGAAYGVYKLVQKLREESLRGQVVLITGDAGWFAGAQFAREGCRVAICARDEDELADAARDCGGRAPMLRPALRRGRAARY